ncbi:hypothetical protein ACIQZG_05965 [Lysinibacillus sp. NPDC096418]|uniref:hypothetical protein n=1 Tax=Lysinibacillus sp. NPDC096418 TaxID=3364138 RepID=UPI0038155ABC
MTDKDIQEVLMKRLTNGFMKDQPELLKEDDRSFVFLEKGTLNLLLAYVLSGERRKTTEEGNEEFELKILAELDQTIENNKKEFEEIMELLKGFK